MVARFIGIASGLLIASGIVWSAFRVVAHEQGELAFTSQRKTLAAAALHQGSTRVTARLASLQLRAGDHAVFEVCADDGLRPANWRDMPGFAVFQLQPLKLLLRVPLDQPHLSVVKRNGQEACLALGGGRIEADGPVAVDAILPEANRLAAISGTALWLRVLATTPLSDGDRMPVLLIASGALLLVLGLFIVRIQAPPSQPQPGARGSSASALAVGLCVVVVGWLASATIGPFGASWGLAKTVALASVEVLGAVILVRWQLAERSSTVLLSLHAPRRAPWLMLLAAPASGLLLIASAIVCLRALPSTSESAIETFISWPSGMLAFAAIGAFVPLCEEIFFRGFVYARALSFGKGAAFLISAGSFVALHAAQTWGNWGSLLSIAITGVVLTSLRATTGSTLIPAIAHIVYNLGLTLRSF